MKMLHCGPTPPLCSLPGWGGEQRVEGTQQLRQSELENLGPAMFRHEDVRRLDVTMDDALLVRGVQRVGNLGITFRSQ